MFLNKSVITLGLFLGIGTVVLGQEINMGPHSLKSHGYVRTGLGTSFSGSEMVQFQAPGTMAKPRLGNEANHYGELQFDYKYQPENRDDSYEMVYMMAAYKPYASADNTDSEFEFETSQLYFKWNNFYKDMDVWVGKRYYQRQNIEILDWFWLNSTQSADVGVGLENIKVNEQSVMDVAFMRFSDDLVDPNINQDKFFEDYKLDVRFKNLGLSPNLNLNFVGQFGFRTGVENTPYKDETGYAFGAWSVYEKGNFYNRTSAIYRQGVNIVEVSSSGKGVLEVAPTGEQIYDLDDANDIQITSDFRYDDHNKNGFLGVLTYHYKDFGIDTPLGNKKTFSHFNASGRYSYYLTDRFSLTFEAGYDYIDQKDGANGGLGKITFSPEFRWSKDMFSRPSLRPFITYATWSKDLEGQVGIFNGNDAYKDKTNGVTAGLQLEIWW